MPRFISIPCRVLVDHPVSSIKPPDGELDGTTEEPDHTHHILVDEVYQFIASNTSTPVVGSWSLSLILTSSFDIISFLAISPFVIANAMYL